LGDVYGTKIEQIKVEEVNKSSIGMVAFISKNITLRSVRSVRLMHLTLER